MTRQTTAVRTSASDRHLLRTNEVHLSLSRRQSLLLLIKPELSGENENSGRSAFNLHEHDSHSVCEDFPFETGCDVSAWNQRRFCLTQQRFPNDFVTSCTGKKKNIPCLRWTRDFNIKWYEKLTDRVSESTLQLTVKRLARTDSCQSIHSHLNEHAAHF